MLPKDFTEISSQMRAVLIYLFFPPSPGKKKKKKERMLSAADLDKAES